jgi:hypothetical protein
MQFHGDAAAILQATHALAFHDGQTFGDQTHVFYKCTPDTNKVLSQLITYYLGNDSRARDLYVQTKSDIVNQLGPTSTDSERLSALGRMRLWRVTSPYDAVNEFSSWTTATDHDVYLGITKGRSDSQWIVTTVDEVRRVTDSVSLPRRPAITADEALLSAVVLAAICSAWAALQWYSARWSFAMAAALLISLVLYLLPLARGNDYANIRGLKPGYPTFIASLTACAIVSFLIVRNLGYRMRPLLSATQHWRSTGRLLVQMACLLVVAQGLWLEWLFRPGNQPDLMQGRVTVSYVLPLVALLSAIAVTLGTVRLLKAPHRKSEHIAVIDTGFTVIGIVGTILVITSLVQSLVAILTSG